MAETAKKALAQSLKKLMKMKPIHKISIREISEDSGYNRQTFYYHFDDIYDLLRWIYRQETIILLDNEKGADSWRHGFLDLFAYVEKNKKVFFSTLQSIQRQQLKHFFFDDIYRIIKDTVYKTVENEIQIDEKYGEFIAHFYTISLVALVESYVNDEMSLGPEEIVDFIDITIKDQITGALKRHGTEGQV